LRAGEIALELWYDAGQRGAAEVARLGERLTCALEGAVASPAAAVDALPLVGPEEALLLSKFCLTEHGWPTGHPPHDRFEAQVARTPTHDAVVFGADRLTSTQLSARSSQLANHLRAFEVGLGGRVGLCLERGVDLLTGVLGVLKAGAA